VPGIWMGRGPKVFSFFGAAGDLSNSFFRPLRSPESWYPRCLYFGSDKKVPPEKRLILRLCEARHKGFFANAQKWRYLPEQPREQTATLSAACDQWLGELFFTYHGATIRYRTNLRRQLWRSAMAVGFCGSWRDSA
jgi:hypothetical protein